MLETRLKTAGIDHTVLHVKDLARSKKFYMEVLGMTVNHESAQIAQASEASSRSESANNVLNC